MAVVRFEAPMSLCHQHGRSVEMLLVRAIDDTFLQVRILLLDYLESKRIPVSNNRFSTHEVFFESSILIVIVATPSSTESNSIICEDVKDFASRSRSSCMMNFVDYERES